MKYYILIIIIIIIIVYNLISYITIEPFENNLEEITGSSLCSIYSSNPKELNDKCGSLTEQNCNSMSCCVWLNASKCVAGNGNGPTFRTNNGKDIPIDTYYYMGRLNGN
jgi:hypothetical protein